MSAFTKDELMRIVRWAMQKAEVTDQGEAFAQTVAGIMYETMCSLESKEGDNS